MVWVDPGRCGGSPCIMGTRITTEAAAGLAWSSGIAAALECWPHVTREQILGACWYEVTHGNRRRWRKRYGDWATEWSQQIWEGRWTEVSEPPRAEAV